MFEQVQTPNMAAASENPSPQAPATNPNPEGGASPQVPVEPSAGAAAPVNALARPEGLPDDFWDETTGVKMPDLLAKFKEASEFKSQADARKALIPASADAYQVKLPDDVKLPEGWRINEADPRLNGAREFALAAGMTQEQFSKMVALDLAREQARVQGIAQAIKARDAALGANGPARVEAIHKFFDASAPSPEVARQLKETLFTPGIIEFMEGMAKNYVSQGVGSPTRVGGNGSDQTGKIPGFENMTFIQRAAAAMNLGIKS